MSQNGNVSDPFGWWHFTDAASARTIEVIPNFPKALHTVYFGDGEGNSTVGGGDADHLYGGGGDDTLDGSGETMAANDDEFRPSQRRIAA